MAFDFTDINDNNDNVLVDAYINTINKNWRKDVFSHLKYLNYIRMELFDNNIINVDSNNVKTLIFDSSVKYDYHMPIVYMLLTKYADIFDTLCYKIKLNIHYFNLEKHLFKCKLSDILPHEQSILIEPFYRFENIMQLFKIFQKYVVDVNNEPIKFTWDLFVNAVTPTMFQDLHNVYKTVAKNRDLFSHVYMPYWVFENYYNYCKKNNIAAGTILREQRNIFLRMDQIPISYFWDLHERIYLIELENLLMKAANGIRF